LYRREDTTSATHRKAVLVGVARGGEPGYLVEEHLDELAQLARTAGVVPAGRAVQRRPAPDSATFIGRGKAEEVAAAASTLGADLVLFDDDLTGSQVKNLEKLMDRQVMDRSSLILEIFELRARTREARTQVELARLNYLLPRLTRRWRHLSRQAGGIGQRGGEGEKQIEADRRMLRHRIRRLERDLEKIERTREVQRRGRRGTVTVSLAGYTNAGKTTLFNRLTDAGAHAEDKLFATLDSKLRRGALDAGRVVVFADTVGFIRKLPHHLVSSFRSTLAEVTDADLVLHVIDRSHPLWDDQAAVAEGVLADLGVEPGRVLRVYNKGDRVEAAPPAGHLEADGGVWASAATGEGLEPLKAEIARRLDRLERLGVEAGAAWPAYAGDGHGDAGEPGSPRPPASDAASGARVAEGGERVPAGRGRGAARGRAAAEPGAAGPPDDNPFAGFLDDEDDRETARLTPAGAGSRRR
jgi:GTP-binding protein HflX